MLLARDDPSKLTVHLAGEPFVGVTNDCAKACSAAADSQTSGKP
ncbi:Hypothetical protein (plasmid) [Pseudomonas putida]|nr:Hypothetical protein [Pseudomonas putida]